jgi:hypothetical protein
LSKVTERLSSLNFATWTLVILFLWFVWGLVLAGSKVFFYGFREMNSTLVRDWLLDPAQGMMHLKVWFVGLCMVMSVMGVNLVFCSWNRILKIMRNRFSGAKLFMLIVHMIFGLVALGHFGGFMLGYKHGDVVLEKGEVFSFEHDFDLKVMDVHFVDDPEVLKKSRREIMRDEIHYKSNFVGVTLFQEDQMVMSGRVYHLRPLKYRNVRITLKQFLPPNPDVGASKGLPCVKLEVSYNPVLKVFLVIYPLMIIGIVIHLIMTWRLPEK